MAEAPLPQAIPSRPLPEREIISPVLLTLPDGHLNDDAVGWTRAPLVITDGIGRGARTWGRSRRWEQWTVTTTTHVVTLTVSDLDYAALHGIWIVDRRSGAEIAHDSVGLLAGSASLPGTLGRGPVRARTLPVRIDIDEIETGTRLRAVGERVRVDIVAHRPEPHESLGVVVPWSRRRFLYTVKDVARPAEGTLYIDGRPEPFAAGASWATHDHGRGRWPRTPAWTSGTASGVTDGQVVGFHLGGRWADGTGSAPNGLLVDGRLSKVSEELAWEYSPEEWMTPWTVRGDTVELTFTPEHARTSSAGTAFGPSTAKQFFGTWSGRVRDENGRWVTVTDLFGSTEEVRTRW